jgi:hypothetical protein
MTDIQSVAGPLDKLGLGLKLYTAILSLIAAYKGIPKLWHLWETRNLSKIWGIKNGEHITLICSELDTPEARQNLEPREFIYNLKYGDVDAYFEVVVTLLKLYPKLKLRILSAGEVESARMDMAQTIVLIGGPDYNPVTARILKENITQIIYRSPLEAERSVSHPDEIVICQKTDNREFCHTDLMRDYGYFERIRSPFNPAKNIILIGGCHTVGVTAAAKAFSMASSEHGEIPSAVLNNSKRAVRAIGDSREFVVIVEALRLGQTINTPSIHESLISVKAPNTERII